MSQKQSTKDLQQTLDAKSIIGVEDKDALVRSLKKICPCLSELKEKTPALHLDDLAKALVAPAILGHRSKEVKLMVACCLADILRIYAPDAPYSEKQIKNIFESFLDQLQLLNQTSSPNFTRVFYLLESFSNVALALILVEMGDQGFPLLVRIFRVFFDLAKEELDTKIQALFNNILSGVITEMGTGKIPAAIFYTVLAHLVPPHREKNNNGYEMAKSLIMRCEGEFERCIIGYVTDTVILAREFPEEDRDVYYESLLDNRTSQLEVMYEICCNFPNLLLSLSCDLQDLLETEDNEQRPEWVTLFCRVFSTPNSEWAHTLKAGDTTATGIFQMFLKRFNDKDMNIRHQMCEAAERLLPYDSEKICDYLLKRVEDREERVRRAAVTSVCNAGLNHPQCVDMAILNAVGRRTLDKRPLVRREAIEGLADLFRRHCSDSWKDGLPLVQQAKKFSWIPRKLITSTHQSGTEARMLVEGLLDDVILDLKYTIPERAKCLVGICASLDEASRKIFIRNMQAKQRFQSYVQGLLHLQVQMKADPLNKILARRHIVFLKNMAKTFASDDSPESEKVVKGLREIVEHKDKNVRKWLLMLADCTTPYEQLRTAQTEFVRAFSGKTTKKAARKDTLAWRITSILAMTVLNVDSIASIFDQALDNLKNKRTLLTVAALELLQRVSGVFPKLIAHSNSYDQIISLCAHAHDKPQIAHKALSILAKCIDKDQPRIDYQTYSNILELAKKLITGTDAKLAKLGVRIVANVLGSQQPPPAQTAENGVGSPNHKSPPMSPPPPRKRGKAGKADEDSLPTAAQALEEIFKSCVPKLDAAKAALSALLYVLGEVAMADLQLFESKSSVVTDFITDLLSTAASDPDKPDPLLVAKLAGVKTLVKYLKAVAQTNKDAATADEKSLATLKLLFSVIDSQGDLTGTRRQEDEDDQPDTAPANQECDKLVLFAAKGMLKLCEHSQFEKSLVSMEAPANKGPSPKTYKPFLSVALVAHHESHTVRTNFVNYVFNRLKEDKLPFHFIIILTLCATHEKDVQDKMQQAVASLMVRERQRWRQRQQLVAEASPSKADAAKLNTKLPELVLSHLIYLLSYHPDFVVDDSDPVQGKIVYDWFLQFIDFFLKCLFTGEGHANNFDLISKMCLHIKNCEDTRDPNNEGIYKLSELTHQKLKSFYQGKQWETHPGAITLPIRLYKPRQTRAAVRYLPAWYKMDKVENEISKVLPPSPATAKSERAASAKEEQAAEKAAATATKAKAKDKGSTQKTSSQKRKSPSKSTSTPTRERLPRGAKSGVKMLDFDSGGEEELDALADQQEEKEDVQDPMAEGEDEEQEEAEVAEEEEAAAPPAKRNRGSRAASPAPNAKTPALARSKKTPAKSPAKPKSPVKSAKKSPAKSPAKSPPQSLTNGSPAKSPSKTTKESASAKKSGGAFRTKRRSAK